MNILLLHIISILVMQGSVRLKRFSTLPNKFLHTQNLYIYNGSVRSSKTDFAVDGSFAAVKCLELM